MIGEGVLSQPIGGQDTLRGQLRHLVTMSSLDNVSIQIIPAASGWTPANDGKFQLFEFPKAVPLVALDSYQSVMFVVDPKQLAGYSAAAGKMIASALDPESSLRLIVKRLSTLEG